MCVCTGLTNRFNGGPNKKVFFILSFAPDAKFNVKEPPITLYKSMVLVLHLTSDETEEVGRYCSVWLL